MESDKNWPGRQSGSNHLNKSQKNLEQDSSKRSKSKSGQKKCKPGNLNEVIVPGSVLDNFVILKEIFGYLSLPDLRNCCEVNQTWRAIADPMVFEYHLLRVIVSGSRVEVKTTKGYIDPEIHTRWSSIEAETEFLQNIKRSSVIILDLRDPVSSYRNVDFRGFVTRFGSMVYRLNLADHPWVGFGDTDEPPINFCDDFPNVEDLRFIGQYTADSELMLYFNHFNASTARKFRINSSLLHVQKLYFQPFQRSYTISYNSVTASRLLELVPNVKEIYGVPFTMVKEFERLERLHILRSVRFLRHGHILTETEGMQMLVQAKLKFHSLFIGKKFEDELDLNFIQKNKKAFGALLELGKDTIEHFVIRPLKPTALIVFPNEMPAVKHIALWGISNDGYQYFEHGEDLSKRFPNVHTISFHNLTALTWPISESWWLPGGIFCSQDFRRKIKFLKSDEKLERSVEWKLRNKFNFVRDIQVETTDPYKDDYISEGIIFSLNVL